MQENAYRFCSRSYRVGRKQRLYRHWKANLLAKRYEKKYLDAKCGNIIAISPLLERHYTSQGANVLRLPPIYQNDDFRTEPMQISEKPLKLVLQGHLPKKISYYQ